MNAQQQRQTSRWGSLLSGAVAGLESRLDTILADDETRAAEEASRKAKLAANPKQEALKTESKDTSRASSRNRTNDRLQDRLAKAVVKGADTPRSGSRPPSEIHSQTASPRPSVTIARASTDSRRSESQHEPPNAHDEVTESEEMEARTSKDEDSTMPQKRPNDIPNPISITSTPAIETSSPQSTRASHDSTRLSFDSLPRAEAAASSAPTSLKRTPSFLESELERVTKTQEENNRNYQEELHAHLERIDALQAKLAYLASQASATARAAASEAGSGSLEKKLAEQEEKIAQLLEEGQKLSKTEMKHLGTIKKMRQRMQEDEKDKTELKRRLTKTEQEREDQRDRLRVVEERERAAQERLNYLPKLEQEVDTLKREKDGVNREVSELKRQLAEAEQRADDAEKRAQTDKLEQQMRVVAELNDELDNVRIEKKLVEDRAKAEVKKIKEEAAQQQEKGQLLELELRSEVQNLETKLELLRSRTEEVTSNTGTDAQAKLLRQVETLQSQYALASENWQALETSMNARIAALEKERDDIAKREADVRKKAREVNAKARRLEEELETEKDKSGTFETELNEQKATLAKMQTRLSAAEAAVQEARADAEREKKALEKEMHTRIDEERTKWKVENINHSIPPTPSESNHFLRAESPTMSFSLRKTSNPDLLGLHGRRSNPGSKAFSPDLPPLFTENNRPSSRRTSTQPPGHYPGYPTRTPTDSATPSRQESLASLPHLNGSVPPSASISVAPSIDAVDDQLERDSISSPHRTVNELISVSTVGAGPSVQLVERMSAAVRRLESEKAANKEEMARIVGQRDEAREEVVSLMREMETLKSEKGRIGKLEEEVKEIKGRYDAALELLGEKSEECEELRNDVQDLKKIYRELVESTLK